MHGAMQTTIVAYIKKVYRKNLWQDVIVIVMTCLIGPFVALCQHAQRSNAGRLDWPSRCLEPAQVLNLT